jgi:hypothetical protein
MSDKVSARSTNANVFTSTGPDVCLTPVGSDMVPVAYSSFARLKDSVRVNSTVFNNSLNDFHLNSRAPATQGHEPGTGKGVVAPGYKGWAHVTQTTPSHFSSGWAVCRHRDPGSINMASPGPTEPRTGMDGSAK